MPARIARRPHPRLTVPDGRLIGFDRSLARRRIRRNRGGMPSWSSFAAAAPELAAAVQERLDAHVHKTLATLRRDGSPRISGTETRLEDGELWIGSMWGARKAVDLQRDGRYALHSGSDDPPGWTGDAKLSGVAHEVTDPETVARLNGEAAAQGPSHLFRLEVREASTVALAEGGRAIVVTSWSPERGVRTTTRA
jgi:hypothetical protein